MANANRTLRSSMLLTTAMAAAFAVPGVAHAQLVTDGDLVDAIDSGGNPGQLDVVNTTLTQTDMTVRAPTVVANWTRFNVPVGTVLNVANGTANPTATLVNRVIGPNVSDIGGTINAADVNFWLINQNGILFGADTQINTRSFFASTLDVTDQDLFDFYEGTDLAGNGATTLNFGSSLGNSISGGGANASFVTDGTMMFVSEQLNLDAEFDAQTGGVAFVTAADVNVTFTPGSPLSFVLNAGTTVAEGQTIAGSVSGSSIDFQMLTAAGVVDALLKVDATLNATTASATDTGIRLFAQQADTASVTVEMTGGITSTGLIDLRTDGALSSTAAISGSGVTVNGSGGLTLDDVTATGGAVRLDTAGSIVAGDIQATGEIRFSASNSGSATFGSLVSSGGAVNVLGNVPGVLTVTGDISGVSVDLGAVNQLLLGNVTSTAGGISLTGFRGSISAGNVSANGGSVTLSSAIFGSINPANEFVNVGNVSAVGGNVTINVPGAVTTTGITASGLIDIDSTAGGALNLGTLDASGNIDLDTTGSITTAAITAGGNLTVGAVRLPGGVTFTGAASASNITIDTAGAFMGTTLTATTGSVDVDAGSISAGNIAATTGNVLLDATDNITTGSITANQFSSTAGTITVRSANGDLTLGNLVAGFDIALDAGGDISGTSASSRGGVLTIGQTTAPGAVTFTGALTAQSVTIDALGAFTGADITARIGDLDIDAQSITAGTVRAGAGDVLLVADGNITTGAVNADPLNTAGGTLTIRSTAGGTLNLGALSSGGDLTLDTAGIITGTSATSRGGAVLIGQTSAPGGVTFTGSVNGTSVTIDATGAFSALDIGASAGDIDIAALSIAVRDVRSQTGNVLLTATNNITTGLVAADIQNTGTGRVAIASLAGGTLSLGGLSSSGDLTLDTTGNISGTTANSRRGNLVIGGTAIPGTVTFTGALIGQSVFVDALGAFSSGGITTRAGTLDIDALSISTGALSALGGDVILTADEAITTGAITATAAGGVGGTIDVLTTGAFAVTTGNLTASADILLDGDLTISTGAIRAGGGLFVGGGSDATDVTFGGSAVAQEIAVTINGALTAAALTATNGDVFVTADSMTAGNITATAGDVSLVTTKGITTANIIAAEVGGVGGLVLVDSTDGGTITLGNVTADQNILIDTAGNITAGNLTSNKASVFVGAFRQPALGTSTTLGNLRGQQVFVETLGSLQTGNVTATAGAVTLTADTIAALAVSATGGDVTLRANGDITSTAITARTALGNGGGIDVSSLAGGDLILGTLGADQSILLNTAGSVATGAVTAGLAFNVGQTAIPSSVTLGGNVTAESIFIRAVGEVLAGERDAQGNLLRVTNVTATRGGLSIEAGSITSGNLRTTSGDVSLSASGAIATGDVTATIANGNGGNIIIDSSGSGLTLGTLTASTDITLDALGAIRTGMITATGGALNVGTNRVATSVTFLGTATARSITVRTSGAFEATDLTATAGNLTTDVGSMSAAALRATGGDVSLTAVNSIETGTINSTGMITATSTGAAGDLTLGALTAAGNITLNAERNIGTGAITSTGGILRVGLTSNADRVTFGGDATARSILVRTAGRFEAFDLTSTAGVIDVDAGSIDTDAISATGGSVSLDAQTSIDTAAITSTGSIGVTSLGTGMGAGNVFVGRLTATDNVIIDGNGTITTGAITAGGVLQVGLFSDATGVTFSGDASARSIEVDTIGTLQAMRLTSTAGSVTANANAMTTGAISATGGGVTLTALRGITTGTIDADTAISVASTGTGANAGNVSLGALTAGANITLNGNGTIGTGAITSTGGALLVGLTSAAQSVTFGGAASARTISVNSAGTITAQQLTATAGDVTLTAVRGIGTGAIGATGAITATSTGTGANAGNLALGALTAGGNITLDGNGRITTAAVTSTGGALRVGLNSAATSVNFGGSASARSITVRSTGAVTAERRDEEGVLLGRTNLTATAGDVTVNGASITTGAITATGGAATLTASGAITTGAITATRVAGVGGAIRVLSTGTGANAGILNLGALLADLGIELDAGGAITTGAMTARGGAVDVEGASINVTGNAAATGGNVRLLASGAITTGALSASLAGNVGGAIDVDSTGGGAINLGALNAARGITIDTTGTVTTLAATAANDLVIGLDRRTSAITLNGAVQAANVNAISSGTVTANAINVGNGTVRIESADVQLRAGVDAGTVTLKSFNNGTIGLGTAAGTMRLTDAELDLIDAGTLNIDAGTGNIGIAGVSFTTEAGSSQVNIATIGNIAITGDLSGTGASRTFRLGGALTDPANVPPTTAARITANIDAGTIDLGTATLDLRGNNIVFGQQSLIDKVATMTLDQQVKELIGNAGSLLYTPENLSAARLANPTYLTAARMRVTYGGSALFQNAVPRTGGSAFDGVKLGTTPAPANPPLVLNPLNTAVVENFNVRQGNVFAIFGSINGASGPAASLGGETVISVNDKVLVPASRVNGCIIGSGEGCVTTIVGNFVLSVPREVVSPIVADEGTPLPFDPLVGTNNESLFSDAATAPEGEDCRERDAAGACVGN